MAKVSFNLNGKPVCCEAEGDEILTDTIRSRFKLTGTKRGCGTGDCGACTVLVDDVAVRSCTMLTGDGRRQKCDDHRRFGNDRPIAPCTTGLCGRQCGTMRILHSRYGTYRIRTAEGDSQSNRRRNPHCYFWKFMQVYGISKIVEAIQLASKRMQEKKGL